MKEETYSIGQIFQRSDRGGYLLDHAFYILSMIDDPPLSTLIGLRGGNRWKEPVSIPVQHGMYGITQEDLAEIIGAHEFHLVGKIGEVYLCNCSSEEYEVGQVYSIKGSHYILSSVGDRLRGLICLTDGNRWHEPVKVRDYVNYISPEEFEKIARGDKFKLAGKIEAFRVGNELFTVRG